MAKAHSEIKGVRAKEARDVDPDIVENKHVREVDRREDRKLDKALADSFPASDPMPASPGAD